MGAIEFPFVTIPPRLAEVIGEPDPGTRMFRQIGRAVHSEAWWDAVCEICGRHGAVSPGGAAMFARVSRMGVYKRMKEGRISAFLFHEVPEGRKWSVWSLLETGGRLPVVYIPVCEIKAWGEVLAKRPSREALLDGDGYGERDDEFLWKKRKELVEAVRKREAKRR